MLTHAPPELHRVTASMKVPPKRKGNSGLTIGAGAGRAGPQ